MAAARDEREEGRFQLGERDEVRGDMPLDVVDLDERSAQSVSERLGGGHAHEQAADQTRAVGDRDGVYAFLGDARARERLVDGGHDRKQVVTARDLGHDAAETAVYVYLAGDGASEQFPAVPDDGRRRFVAGRLDTEYINILIHDPY